MRALSFLSLDPASKNFSNAPGLRDAASRAEWRLGVKDLAYRSDPCRAQRGIETCKEGSGFSEIARMDSQPRIYERPDEPGPDRALMVSGIARSKIAIIFRLVIRITRIKSAKSQGREQTFGD